MGGTLISNWDALHLDTPGASVNFVIPDQPRLDAPAACALGLILVVVPKPISIPHHHR